MVTGCEMPGNPSIPATSSGVKEDICGLKVISPSLSSMIQSCVSVISTGASGWLSTGSSSSEEYTEEIIKNDKELKRCLRIDRITYKDICDFKEYSIVDNKRPKLCADRYDGLILTGYNWTKSIELNDILDFTNIIPVTVGTSKLSILSLLKDKKKTFLKSLFFNILSLKVES